MFYSDFRADAGSEAFELVLKSNGYEAFDPHKPQTTKHLRYTFITGSESSEERRINKEFFNDDKNTSGEYIQIMIISSAGAEGLSLKCVRQVHILEPYWNYVRIDQVLGRAIRMRSHSDLKPKERTVEQYLYLSVIPKGVNVDTAYDSVSKLPTWGAPTLTDVTTDLTKNQHKEFKEILENLVNISIQEQNLSVDDQLFNKMETKYKVSQEINAVIKESALDCIPHTRDDPDVQDRCIRFSSKLQGELAFFPGMTAFNVETLDTTQLRATLRIFQGSDICIVSTTGTEPMLIYYRYTLQRDETREDLDIRYLRENATRVADLYPDKRLLLAYVSKDHPMNEPLGKEFSVFQELYEVVEEIDLTGDDPTAPSLLETLAHDPKGYKLKYNINGTFYMSEHRALSDPRAIVKLYPYKQYEAHNYECHAIRPLVLYNDAIYRRTS